ncbi:MAG: hypothetical protein ACRETL_01690 [Gammaproteobacteria bacterium]
MIGAVLLGAALPAAAEGLVGSWSGGGSVQLPSGDMERARCKATFHRAGGKSYSMNAVCASSSARVAQTASLQQVSANRFAGDFTNSEYNVSGTISITLSGDSLSAHLDGGGASAHFNLSR